MAAHSPQLDRESLKRLREMAQLLGASTRRTLPMEELIELAAAARVGAGVTIDFEASRELGEAMIVLRVPATLPDQSADLLTLLSPREREVAGLVSKGLSNKHIAHRLGISTSTVKDHLHNILRKTALSNRAAIAAACRGSIDGG